MAMTGQASYYTEHEAQDAMAVVAGWIGENRGIRVQYHSGTAVDASIETATLRIPKLACASGITQEALMLLRTRIYHEAGHIAETDEKKPAGALGEIMNALEDRRMEAAVGKKHEGARVVLRWGNEWYNKDIARHAMDEGLNAPLWEALCAMALMVEGIHPAWTLSDKAQAYVDAAYDEFVKVHTCRNTKDCVELAKRILALLKDANEQYKKEQPPQPQGPGQPQPQQDGEPQEQDGEPQASGQGDLDEEQPEQNDKQQSKSGGKSDDDSEDEDDGSDKKGGSKSKGDDSEDEGDESADGKGDDEGDEDKDSAGGAGDEDGDGDADGDDESEGGSSGKGDSDDEDGEEADRDDGQKEDGPDGDADYEPDDSGRGEYTNGDGSDEDDEADEWKDTGLEDELDGLSREAALNEAIEEYFEDMDPADAAYMSRRDLDEHRIPTTRDSDKVAFKSQREMVAVMAASMTRALEQALRSLSRTKREGYKRQGRLDRKRLTAIAKGLSKEVFYKIRDGHQLEVAVEIIIDESGSMGNYMAVRLLAIAIGEALNSIGVPFEITGTTTKYGMGDYGCPSLDGMTRTNPIKYNHYVMFGETWEAVRHRLVKTGAHMHNVDGEAIEYCVFRLQQRPERRKVVFSLSDGAPCGGQGRDTELGQNIVRVCKKARKHGVEVYGFGVQTQQPQRFYGKENFIYLADPTTMDQVFLRKLAEVVTGGQVRI